MTKIQNYITNKHKYKVDRTYQRPAGAWSTADQQCLIDTIIKGEPMPLFFLNFNSEKDLYYIVDGQQRLEAIEKFYFNKLKLNKKFSGEENHGRTFNDKNPIDDTHRDRFLNYELSFKILNNYNDEQVRLIFSRLQRGKPLTLGERLNAKPGEIVISMREIAKHPFMLKSIGIVKKRYGIYPDAARILFYEKYKEQQCGTNEIMKFFEEFPNLSTESKEYRNAISNLNFLAKCFSPEPGDYKFLSKHAWVYAVYTMIHNLRKKYSLNGKENLIKKFIEQFHSLVYTDDFRNTNRDYQKFYENIRGGWSEKIISLRRDILIQEFLKKYKLEELDVKRQISDEEKIAAYGKNPKCMKCGKSFKDYREAEYHHKVRYVEGGKSNINNIIVLYKDCHQAINKE